MEIRQNVFGDAFETWRGHLSAFVQSHRGIQRDKNGHRRIVDRRKSCEGSDELCTRVAPGGGFNLLRRTRFSSRSPSIKTRLAARPIHPAPFHQPPHRCHCSSTTAA